MDIHNQTFVNKLKLDFNILVDLSEVTFNNTSIKKYNQNESNFFGEKLCLLYTAHFTIYNLAFSIKVLAFVYENSSEVLKLDIDIGNKDLEKEISACRNFLQRHRNLSAMFTKLIQFAKFVETRRLILTIVLNKDSKVLLSKHADGGLIIKYVDTLPQILIMISWKIDWNLKDSSVVDVIEVLYNNFKLPNQKVITERLVSLTHPCLDFQIKLKHWRCLLDELKQNTTNTLQAVITIKESPRSEADSVFVISDNEEESNNAGVSKVMSNNKRRRIDAPVASSSVIHVVPD